MQVMEITLGATRKRPAGQYASDEASAYVKIAVHPGDDLTRVLTEGRSILEQALHEATLGGSTAGAAPASPATAFRQAAAAADAEAERAHARRLLVRARSNSPTARQQLRALGFRATTSGIMEALLREDELPRVRGTPGVEIVSNEPTQE